MTRRGKSHDPRRDSPANADARPILIVGSGTAFISGISYFTHKLAIALGGRSRVAVVLMRRLIPRALYPGRDRVGLPISDLRYPETMSVVDGIDWYGGLGLIRALWLIGRQRPRIVLLQWWTGAVLHTYIVLALWARLWGAKLIVEFHEVQDTGEAGLTGVTRYVDLLSGWLMSKTSGSIVHSQSDVDPVSHRFGVGDRPLMVIPHGPFDQYADADPIRDAPTDAINVLFFGTIRPYKGLEDLVRAFDALDEHDAARFWLTVVGETWEGWTEPSELIARSRHRERITFVNRYLSDAELAGYLAGADAAALPYRRSSASGPLHVAMSHGLPVIVTEVGGLPEAGRDYPGAVWIPPADVGAILAAFDRVAALTGTRYPDPHSWDANADRYEQLIASVERAAGDSVPSPPHP